MAKIPSRKFPPAKKKISSRPFPKSKATIPSKPLAKGTAKIASRKFSKAPAAASKPPAVTKIVDRPASKPTRQEFFSEMKGKVTPARNLESPPLKPTAMQNEFVTRSHSNLFTDIPQSLPEELFTPLLEAEIFRFERIVSHGHASPDAIWYDQDHHELVILLKGAARLRFEDGTAEMNPGDFVNIPAHTRHQVEWATPDEPTIWLAVYYR